jgi:peptidoglycan/xylan/chitin deacetylase (PgdA/CDA1 family)
MKISSQLANKFRLLQCVTKISAYSALAAAFLKRPFMLHLPILCYHHIGAPKKSLGHQRLWISKERFTEQMSYLSQMGYRGMTLRDAAAALAERRRLSQAVVVTFDDGYKSFYHIAFPILCRFGLSATVFAVTGKVGDASRWDLESAAELMDWSELRELHQAGVEVGSHTVNHPRLTQMPADAAKREIENSRQALEQELGAAVSSFAYPYGDWNDAVARLAEQARYRVACSTLRGNLHWPEDLYHLKRVPVHEFTGLRRFRHRLSPVYDFTCRLRSTLRGLRLADLNKENT